MSVREVKSQIACDDEKDGKSPFFSIVLVIKDYPHLVSVTLDSIIRQTYPSYEIIVVESGSSERTLEIIRSYGDKIKQLHSQTKGNLAKLMNKALQLTEGKYIQFLYPGDSYLPKYALNFISKEIEKNPNADLIYSGFLQRSREKAPEVLIFPINAKILKKGRFPTRLQCCWFSKKVFENLGDFDASYEFRAGFELICRIFVHQGYSNIVFTKRILTDYEYRHISAQTVLRYALETFFVVRKHFGLRRGLLWFFIQDHLRIFKWMLKTLRQAFWRT